jgi:hypothetical protein
MRIDVARGLRQDFDEQCLLGDRAVQACANLCGTTTGCVDFRLVPISQRRRRLQDGLATHRCVLLAGRCLPLPAGGGDGPVYRVLSTVDEVAYAAAFPAPPPPPPVPPPTPLTETTAVDLGWSTAVCEYTASLLEMGFDVATDQTNLITIIPAGRAGIYIRLQATVSIVFSNFFCCYRRH